MNKILVFILLISGTFLIGKDAVFSQFKQNNSRSLFSDVKAFQVGDAVTILIMEETRADNSASASESRGTELSGSADLEGGSYKTGGSIGLGTGNKFSAEGANSRSENIKTVLSAKVVEVVDNGNLKIDGTRTTKINGETQTVKIKGIVRPVDIKPDNSVYSYNILDLTLFIEGDGNVTEIQEPGLITKFIRLLF